MKQKNPTFLHLFSFAVDISLNLAVNLPYNYSHNLVELSVTAIYKSQKHLLLIIFFALHTNMDYAAQVRFIVMC